MRVGKRVIARLMIMLLAVGCSVWLASCGSEAEPETESPAQSSMMIDSVASADGVNIVYNVRGSGERALVFVHCWSCDDSYWKNQIGVFSDRYKVVTVDLGGHGRSGLERDVWSMSAFGTDVAAVVKKLDLPEVILVGHSMGGTVIIEAARQLPERVVALVGVDTYQNLGRMLDSAQVKQFLAPFQADFVTMTRRFVANMFPATTDSALVAWVIDDMSAAPPEVAIGSISELLNYNAAAALADLPLHIRGINSDRFPVDTVAGKQHAESFAVTLMPGYGHFLQLENPDDFNAKLTQIVEEFWPPEAVE